MTKKEFNRIRSYTMYGLIFFVFIGFSCCSSKSGNDKIQIRWKGKTAEGISIPKALTEGLPSDSVSSLIKVKLVNTDKSVAILGDYTIEPEAILFSPLIPFTRGLHYEVVLNNNRIGTFDIPLADSKDAPQLLGIFPSQDTLPENLLKVYLHFSKPMREGKSDEYVFLVKNDIDTVKGAFLNLQPELWNEDRTVLTLWLDPGRIKRDLQPNKLLGAPLQKNELYQILVSSEWKNQQATALPKVYSKAFVTTVRDSLSPKPRSWKISPPQARSNQPFEVEFGEALDCSLIAGSLSIIDENKKTITGKWEISQKERAASFKPKENWKAGKYFLRIQTKLEDLAGNNINRPFDRDVTKKATEAGYDEFVEVLFLVGK